jgi:hypothetical protein
MFHHQYDAVDCFGGVIDFRHLLNHETESDNKFFQTSNAMPKVYTIPRRIRFYDSHKPFDSWRRIGFMKARPISRGIG